MKLDNFFNNPSLYLFVYLRWIYQLKERYDFENCSSLKNFLSKKPKFHTFYQGLLNLLSKQSFRSQRISYARTGPPGRPGSVCWILSGLLWPGLHGFGGLAKNYIFGGFQICTQILHKAGKGGVMKSIPVVVNESDSYWGGLPLKF